MTLALVFLIVGLVLLVFSADHLVKGAARLATSVGISPLVVGLTVVAFGTSAPELAVSVMSAFKGQADIALGNIVGSNIFNVLVILGISALIVPLVVNQQLVRLDVPIMIALSAMVLLMGLDGRIGRLDGLVLFLIAIGYTTFLIRKSRSEPDASVVEEYEKEFGATESSPRAWLADLTRVVLGVIGLVIGSKLLVDGAVVIARHFGWSELVIGLTIISVGTSLPEVATSVVAALRGERDIAVGNVVGSNIFNIVSVLGLASLVAPHGIPVARQALVLDIPVMLGIAIACLPVFFTGYRITRLNGALFLGYYLLYLMYLYLHVTASPALAGYQSFLLYGVAPFTGVCLIVVLFHVLRCRRNPAC